MPKWRSGSVWANEGISVTTGIDKAIAALGVEDANGIKDDLQLHKRWGGSGVRHAQKFQTRGLLHLGSCGVRGAPDAPAESRY